MELRGLFHVVTAMSLGTKSHYAMNSSPGGPKAGPKLLARVKPGGHMMLPYCSRRTGYDEILLQ